MSQKNKAKEHSVEVRVRYADTDQMRVVYYANYLVWFEIARTEFFRAEGFNYDKLEKERKIYLPVIEAHCRYRAPVRYDDLVTVAAKVTETGNSRIRFEYEVVKNDKVVTTGYTVHAFIDTSGKPIPIPADVRKALEQPRA